MVEEIEKYDSWELKFKRVIKKYKDIEYEIEVTTTSENPSIDLKIRKHVASKYHSRYIEQLELYDIKEGIMLLEELKDVYDKVINEIMGGKNEKDSRMSILQKKGRS